MRVALATLVALLLPATASAVEPGEVVFSELMIASVSAPEWIELYNTAPTATDLSGCVLRESGNEFTIAALSIPSRDYAIGNKGTDDDCVVFDDGGSCVRASDFQYTSLSLNDGSAETIELVCDAVVIDAVTYDWSEFEGDCDGTGAASCSVNVAEDAQSGDGNDDWVGSWCVPPSATFVYDALGREMPATPWAVGACPEAGPPCGPGDAAFTELMMDPPSSTREWFEMKILTASGCDLHACEIWEGPFEEITVDNVGHELWAKHEIDAPGNSLPLASGAYALFSKSVDTVAGSEGDPDAIASDYRYSNITFANGEDAWIYLLCDDDVVDSAPYSWEQFEGACPADGVTSEACSVNLPEVSEDASANDDLGRWCIPPDDVTYIDSHEDQNPYYGTPGQPGACLAQDWPGPGDAMFSELMISPVSSDEGDSFPEWFELANLTSDRLELVGCTIEKHRYGEDGELDPLYDVESYVIGTTGAQPSIPSAGATVFVKSRCIDATEPSSFGTCDFGDSTHFIYESISQSNSSLEELRLLCPTGEAGDPVLVDSAVFDMTLMANRAGHSMEFDVTEADAIDLNDDPEAWCEASFDDCIPGTVTDQGECNFGTPGSAGPCKTGLVGLPPSGVGCRCEGGAGGAAGGLALLMLGGLAWIRRRM